MDGGDAPQIEKAGLADSLKTHWIPITDGTPPQDSQVIEFLNVLAEPGASRIYLHCEAGIGRTGVMTACYRMAVMGWSSQDAQLEAVNFGCSTADQLGFIQDFGRKLLQPDPEFRGYPREPVGSHSLTASEREETLAKAVAASG
jgi:Tyrosine phosphatase family